MNDSFIPAFLAGQGYHFPLILQHCVRFQSFRISLWIFFLNESHARLNRYINILKPYFWGGGGGNNDYLPYIFQPSTFLEFCAYYHFPRILQHCVRFQSFPLSLPPDPTTLRTLPVVSFFTSPWSYNIAYASSRFLYHCPLILQHYVRFQSFPFTYFIVWETYSLFWNQLKSKNSTFFILLFYMFRLKTKCY
jgi:hypothetical protein